MKVKSLTSEELQEIYLNLSFPNSPGDRPYVLINMVSSFDGVVTVRDQESNQASEKGLGSKLDQKIMRVLRTHVDATLNGSATLVISGCSSEINDEKLINLRIRRGKQTNPIACVLSFNGTELSLERVSSQASFFYSPNFDRVLFTTSEASSKLLEKIKATGTQVEVISTKETNVLEMLKIMKEKYQINYLLCEGGPTINGSLLKNKAVDSFFLTFAPHVVGGGKHPVEIKDPLNFGNLVEMEPVSNYFSEETGELFLNYHINS